MLSSETIWWTRIPSAALLLEEIQSALLDRRSVQITSALPWKGEFYYRLNDGLRTDAPGISIDAFNGADLDQDEPLIMQLLSSLGIGSAFDGSVASLKNALGDSAVTVWELRGLRGEHIKQARTLAGELNKSGVRLALLVEDDTPAPAKGLKQIPWKRTSFDIRFFAWTLLMERREVRHIDYAAHMIEALSGGSPEKCAYLCENAAECLRDAKNVVDWMDEAAIQHALHIAQLHALQPLVEMGRLQFIQDHEVGIRALLPFEDEYKNVFEEPNEVELRHMIYYRDALRLNARELDWLNLLKDARNALSHLTLVENDVIDELYEGV